MRAGYKPKALTSDEGLRCDVMVPLSSSASAAAVLCVSVTFHGYEAATAATDSHSWQTCTSGVAMDI